MSIYKVIGLFASLLFFHTLYAQENTEEVTDKAKKNIERIEVKGKKSRRFFRNEYTNYQKDYIASFNKLIDDREMQVVCTYEPHRRLSRIKKRLCQPRFINAILAKETRRELALGGNLQQIVSFQQVSNLSDRSLIQDEMIERFSKFQEITAKLLNEYPELATIYTNMEDALEKYQNYEKD